MKTTAAANDTTAKKHGNPGDVITGRCRKTYEGKVTVKKHEEYKGEPQTTVARAALKVAA